MQLQAGPPYEMLGPSGYPQSLKGISQTQLELKFDCYQQVIGKLGGKSACACQIVHYRSGTLSVTEFVMRVVAIQNISPRNPPKKITKK